MDDTISRAAALAVLHGYFDGMLETDTVCPKDLYNEFEALPSAQQWIPCKTALPELENTRVIMQTNARAVIIDAVYGGTDVYGHHVWRDKEGGLYWDDEIVAWMPGFIPEPYKEGEK